MQTFLIWLVQVAIIVVIFLVGIKYIVPAPKKNNVLPVDWKNQL